MSFLNIREAKREGSKVVIGISGPSGSGKTMTALQIAKGMVNDTKEIGFLDTENKRGSLYSDVLGTPFLIGDFFPPFSPSRYSDAIKEFQAAGVKVLIIDSVSHEWEGEGGCEDIANAPKPNGEVRKVADWKKAKYEHKRFMNTLLQSNMHIIVCIRAREKTSFADPKKPVSLGMQPICEKNFMFEMTVSFMVDNQGQNQIYYKVPGDLHAAFGNLSGQGYLGEETGKAVKAWVDSGVQIDHRIEGLKSDMQMTCEQGLKALKAKFDALNDADKAALAPFLSGYQASAREYDEQRKNDQPVVPAASTGFNPNKPKQPEPKQVPTQATESNQPLADDF